MDSYDDALHLAKDYFQESKYDQAEPLLNQMILQNQKSPEIFHMLGTIYYDQGKFSKAIRAFRRALDLDPRFTDASVGLSIILNDIGRYEEGKQVFEEARNFLQQRKDQDDPYINEKLSIKHDELGEMYFQYGRYRESLEQYDRALVLSTRKPELTMKRVECLLKTGEGQAAIQALMDLIRDEPRYVGARLKLGQINYEMGQVAEAVEQWEWILEQNPDHAEAKRLLKQAQSIELTSPFDALL